MRHSKGKSRSNSAVRNVRRLYVSLFSLRARTTCEEILLRSTALAGAEKDLVT